MIDRRHLITAAIVGLILTGCVPGPSPADDGPDEEEMRAYVADWDVRIERSLWAEGVLEESLGGPDAADEVFTTLWGAMAGLRDDVAGTKPETLYAPASFRQAGSGEAEGAGTFLGLILSNLMATESMNATREGHSGDLGRDFGSELGTGTLVLETADDGTVTSRFEASGEYKGARIDIIVGTDINPCPDPTGVLEPRGVYRLNVTGPDGAGSSTQIVVDLDIQLNDDAEVANFDWEYTADYSVRPQAPGAAFDFSEKSVSFTGDSAGTSTQSDLSVAGFWDEKFSGEAKKVGDFYSRMVALSTLSAAEKGWNDGRCIDLQASHSDGPSGLEPSADVTSTLSPVAKADGAPAGGSVTAELISGGSAISPSKSKVPAVADFTYSAPAKKDESGQVRFESRSKRGVGFLTVTYDTKGVQAFEATGGGGEWVATGTICDVTKPFELSGMGLTFHATPDHAGAGSYTLDGTAADAVWAGDGNYNIEYTDDGAGTLNADGTNTVSSGGYSATDAAEAHFTLTPREPCDAQ